MISENNNSTGQSAASLMDRPANSALRLCFKGGQRDGQVVRISAANCTIGSSESASFRIVCPGVHPIHCMILRGVGGTVVRRMSEDTFLNGETFEDAQLAAGDHLTLGPIELEMLADAPAEAPAEAATANAAEVEAPAPTSEVAAVEQQVVQLQADAQQDPEEAAALRSQLEEVESSKNELNAELESLRSQLESREAELLNQAREDQERIAAEREEESRRMREELEQQMQALEAAREQDRIAREAAEEEARNVREELAARDESSTAGVGTAAAAVAGVLGVGVAAGLGSDATAQEPAEVQEPVQAAPVETYAEPQQPVAEVPAFDQAAEYVAPVVEEQAAQVEPAAPAPVEDYAEPQQPVAETPAFDQAPSVTPFEHLAASDPAPAYEEAPTDEAQAPHDPTQTMAYDHAGFQEEMPATSRNAAMDMLDRLRDEVRADQPDAPGFAAAEVVAPAAAAPVVQEAPAAHEIEQPAHFSPPKADSTMPYDQLMEQMRMSEAAGVDAGLAAAAEAPSLLDPQTSFDHTADAEADVADQPAAQPVEEFGGPQSEEELEFSEPQSSAPVDTASILAKFGHTMDDEPEEASTFAQAEPELTQPEPMQTEPMQTEPMQTEPMQTEQMQPEPVASGGEDESIDDYMEQLMARVGGSYEAPEKPEGASGNAQTVATPQPTPEPPKVESTIPLNPSEFIPRAVAPEASSNLRALRAVANTSARSAIDRHQRRNFDSKAILYWIIAIVFGVVCFAMAFFSKTIMSVPTLVSMLSLVISFFAALRGLAYSARAKLGARTTQRRLAASIEQAS